MEHKIEQIIAALENLAPVYLQETYDNTGLITGDASAICSGVLCCLDATEAIIQEAIDKHCNLVVAHHPIVFSALKKFTGGTYVERALLKAIKHDIAIYAIHTNLDNIAAGVNKIIADKIGIQAGTLRILLPKKGTLSKLYTYVPEAYAGQVKTALFEAGAGSIGLYSECSFASPGSGTFKPLPGSRPFIGREAGNRETVDELKLEFLFPSALQAKMLRSLFKAHPYEEVAYEVVPLANADQYTGSGAIGELAEAMSETGFLDHLKRSFGLQVIRHTPFLNRPVKRVAVCGGAGSFLTKTAIAQQADVLVTSDVKYHEFFDADNRLLLADIGHFESEQYTIGLLANFLQDKLPTFAVLKTGLNTNPVNYFV